MLQNFKLFVKDIFNFLKIAFIADFKKCWI